MQWIRLEGTAYWLVFVCTFLGVAVWESFRPRSPLGWPAEQRWGRHGLILTISALLQTFMIRLSPVVVAAMVSGSRFGILNHSFLPLSVQCALAVLLLDLERYGAHRAFHSVSFLWRIHEVHHSDPDYDVSTAGRFHPFEVLLSRKQAFK